MSYAPLHNHSAFSLLDGLSSPKKIVKWAKELDLPAVAVTDHGSLAGIIEFLEACKEQGVRGIAGYEAYMCVDSSVGKDEHGEAYYHLILLAKDLVGYRNLLALMTESFGPSFFAKPRIDRMMLERHKDGLIVLSACLGSEVAQALLKGDEARAEETMLWYKRMFGDDYYCEIQDHGSEDDATYLEKVVPLAQRLGIPLVATPDSHYLHEDDAEAAQVLHCSNTYSTLAEPKFTLSPYGAYGIPSYEEMEAKFGHIEGALENTLVIADRCNLELDLDARLEFPDTSHVTGDVDPLEWLSATCYGEMDHRDLQPVYEYQGRLAYELSVIEQTGFAEYLILVYDFVKWARDRGIPAVPRGSAAGSLLLYLLGVSDIDPIEYGLTFERFLNPERVQMPDVDMDFADERRHEVFDYLVSRYGRDHVAQIATFGTLKAKAAIKDTARVLGWALDDAAAISKLIPEHPVNLTIDDCLEKVADLKKLYDGDPKVRRLLDLARSVEGVAKSIGVHAAGVVICKDPLSQHAPLQPVKKDSPTIITQYGQKSLEKLGLLKMDVLGLSNLTMVERCLKLIKEHRGVDLDIRQLPDGDPETFAMLCRGETETVFQMGGSGITRYVKELQPRTVRHLAAMVALYRPGPMENISSYIRRRHGKERIQYLNDDLEPILGDTYGIIVYQDQVLKILQVIGGYSLGQADIVRRAMGKKEADLMASEKAKFIEGGLARGYGEEAVDQLWDWIEPFAGYAFNLAHATCYGFLAYQTAYLKAHYPIEWTAAVLQTSSFKPDDLPPLINEARSRALPLLVPDVNSSFVRFSVETMPPGPHGGRGLRYGLGAVKQVGESAAEAIVREREEHGPYTSLRDLLSRVDTRIVTSKTLESLAKAGALEPFGRRESILATLPSISKALTSYKGKVTRRVNAGKAVDVDFPEIALAETFTPPASQYLDWELEALGLFLSDHPFARMNGKVDDPSIAEQMHEFEQEADQAERAKRQGNKRYRGKTFDLTAAVVDVKEIVTKAKKERMAIVTLGDLTGSIEAVVFPRTYRETEDLWSLGSIVRASVHADRRESTLQLIVDAGATSGDFEGVGDVRVTQTSRNPEQMGDMGAPVREILGRLRPSDDPLENLRRRLKLEGAHAACFS